MEEMCEGNVFGRNPFFIRSFIPTEYARSEWRTDKKVAIPFSSGHLFQLRGSETRTISGFQGAFPLMSLHCRKY